MRVIVTGDRTWYVPELAETILARMVSQYGPGLVIVHGGATGVDRSFAEACGLWLQQEAHPARWDDLDHPQAVIRHGKDGRPYNAKAGPIRNNEMVALGAELCLAMHPDIARSKGTKDCVRRAIAAGIPTYLIDSDEAVPRRLGADDPRLG